MAVPTQSLSHLKRGFILGVLKLKSNSSLDSEGMAGGHPVEQQSLTKLVSGTLVITNQRIAFIGTTKSTSVPLAKLLHVECYSDGVAVFQEGRENPDYYLTAQPKYAVFMINWFLNQVAS